MKEPDVLPQQQRENPDPHESPNPAPWPVLVLVALMLAVGIVYIANSRLDNPSSWGDGREAAELAAGKPAAGAKVDGAATYASLCAACHQANGAGLPGVFPPLAGSEWVNGKEGTAAAIVLHGISGSITVKGATYNGAMPTFKDQLSDEQIAAVLTHVRSQWGNTGAAVTAETVAKTRESLKARTAPFAGQQELAALP